MIRNIAGKYQATPIQLHNNWQKNMADLLAETFSQSSSSQNGKPKFIMVKQNAEKYKLYFQ